MSANSKFKLSIGLAAVVVIPALFVFASSDSSCQNAWNQSTASNSCDAGQNSSNTGLYVEWRSGRQECIVSASCFKDTSTQQGETQYNQVYGSLGELRKLKNCKGTLTSSQASCESTAD